MRLPISNRTAQPLALFIEIECDEFEIPVGCTGIVSIEDGKLHAIDVYDGQLTLYNNSGDPVGVEIVPND